MRLICELGLLSHGTNSEGGDLISTKNHNFKVVLFDNFFGGQSCSEPSVGATSPYALPVPASAAHHCATHDCNGPSSSALIADSTPLEMEARFGLAGRSSCLSLLLCPRAITPATRSSSRDTNQWLTAHMFCVLIQTILQQSRENVSFTIWARRDNTNEYSHR
jgi:hypothetical protein